MKSLETNSGNCFYSSAYKSIMSHESNSKSIAGRGGGTYLSEFPCPYCSARNGDLHKPAPHRCADCLALDKDLLNLERNPALRKPLKFTGFDCFRWDQLYCFAEEHRSAACCHNEVLTSTHYKLYEERQADNFFQGS